MPDRVLVYLAIEFFATLDSRDNRMVDKWIIGVLLDCVATLAGAAGKQLLRFAAVKQTPCYYVLGLCLTAVIDPAFDLVAYSYAAQSIIASMAGMVIVWNVLLAPITLGEELILHDDLFAQYSPLQLCSSLERRKYVNGSYPVSKMSDHTALTALP